MRPLLPRLCGLTVWGICLVPNTCACGFPQETPRTKPSALPILPLFSLPGAHELRDAAGAGAGAAAPLEPPALTVQTTPEEQSARTGHETGALPCSVRARSVLS